MNNNKNQGHALVILLFLMALAVTVITAAISLIILSSTGTTSYIAGNQAKAIAEAGIENAIIRLLRNPDYSGENDLTVGNGIVDISVSGTTTKTITAEGTLDNQIKKIQVTVQLINNVLTITSWRETS